MRPNALLTDLDSRLLETIDRLSRSFPQWSGRLATSRSRRELKEALTQLVEEICSRLDATDQTPGSPRKAMHRFVEENLHRGPTLKEIATHLGYSEKYCSELFQVHMGEPFSKYLKQLRMEKATRLLTESHLSVTCIAEALGFSDLFAFSHFFKKAVGCSPKAFRDRSRASGGAAVCPLPKAHG
jgi:AraC-like DNA-binding protein